MRNLALISLAIVTLLLKLEYIEYSFKIANSYHCEKKQTYKLECPSVYSVRLNVSAVKCTQLKCTIQRILMNVPMLLVLSEGKSADIHIIVPLCIMCLSFLSLFPGCLQFGYERSDHGFLCVFLASALLIFFNLLLYVSTNLRNFVPLFHSYIFFLHHSLFSLFL